ncbi:Threonine synthase [Candidatus Anstonella stagnisolia]|nr:Threonine synthase [Candidatus Anstonella stagnisolia]
MKVAQNILELIGETPMVRINRLAPSHVEIYAKLEGQNIGGSVKDRIALSMIEAAERAGELEGKIILEPTSGNTGIGLAIVAAAKGYPLVVTMSAGVSEERKRMLRALGATVIETDALKGTDGAILKAHEIYEKEKGKYWMPNQFANVNNPRAHYEGTAREILEQVPDLDVFVAGMGTSGTLMGVSRRLREQERKIRIIATEPQMGHKIQGLKSLKEAIVPQIWEEKAVDERIIVSDADAYETARELAKKEGIFVGMSSGGAMWAALEVAKKIRGGKIVVIFPDRGEKYLSTALFGQLTPVA